jgi:hypothetical protein
MPKGVYPRTKNQLAAAVHNLAKGREPEARARAGQTLAKIAEDPVWRLKVSDATRERMHDPAVRARHLAGLAKRKGLNFKGGNGQPPTKQVLQAALLLEPLGFKREFPIKTAGHGTGVRCPRNYKADFAHQTRRIVVELDGVGHHGRAKQLEDLRKTTVLTALGWRVVRIKHGKEVCPSHLAAILAEF